MYQLFQNLKSDPVTSDNIHPDPSVMMTPIVPAPETVRQENREFQDSLGNIVRLCQTKDAQPVIVIIIIINRFFLVTGKMVK
jgi:hypothetical protein